MKRLLLLASLAGCAAPPEPKVGQTPNPLTPETLPYAPGLALDLYRPEGQGPYPTVVLIHGGGWKSGNRGQMRSHALVLVKHGIAAASLDYRLAPDNVWPAMREDARAAVRYLRQHGRELRLQTDRIGAAGESAGGHLSFWLGVEGEVQAVGSVSGLHDLRVPMTPEGESYRIVQAALGPAYPEGVADFSPLPKVNGRFPPTFLITGKQDPWVPPVHSEVAERRLRELGVPCEARYVEGMGHGLRLDHPREREAWDEFARWFKARVDAP